MISGAGGLEAYTLSLVETMSVPSQNICLKDIGRVRDKRKKDIKAILEQPFLAKLDAPHYVTAIEIQNILKKNHQELPQRIYGAGTWLIPQNRHLGAIELQKLLYKQIQELSPQKTNVSSQNDFGQFDGVEFQVKKGVKITLPNKDIDLRFHLPPQGLGRRLGQRILPLDLFYHPKIQKFAKQRGTNNKLALLRFQIPVRIQKKISIAVARYDLGIGQRLKKEDFKWEERTIYDDTIRYARTELLRRRVMNPIKKGQAFTEGNVQDVPAVFKGQRLHLSYQKEGIVLRCYSVATSAGYVGDLILVRLLFSGARRAITRRVRIVSENAVELVEPKVVSNSM